MRFCSLVFFVLIGVCGSGYGLHLEFTRREPLNIVVGGSEFVTLHQSDNDTRHQVVYVTSQDHVNPIASATPSTIDKFNGTWSERLEIRGHGGGHSTIIARIVSPNNTKTLPAYIQVIVSRNRLLKVISDVSGWVYFLSWSISYYPQILTNYSRKSVVGLNFDFASLNIIGFFLYSIYNCAMYFSRAIQHQYFHSHPKGMNPVMLNDVIFSLHALLATSVIGYHCCVYERGTQKVSWVAKIIITMYAFIVITSAVLAYRNELSWLEFILYCSYIKLTVTMIKYIPQAIMNYTRKSTVGWSIENVLLDFIGGVFSMLQMAINSYNYDDLDSIFGDPTKFGLGLFSAMFDVFFMYQHYVLYRNPYQEQIIDDVSQSSEEPPTQVSVENDKGESPSNTQAVQS